MPHTEPYESTLPEDYFLPARYWARGPRGRSFDPEILGGRVGGRRTQLPRLPSPPVRPTTVSPTLADPLIGLAGDPVVQEIARRLSDFGSGSDGRDQPGPPGRPGPSPSLDQTDPGPAPNPSPGSATFGLPGVLGRAARSAIGPIASRLGGPIVGLAASILGSMAFNRGQTQSATPAATSGYTEEPGPEPTPDRDRSQTDPGPAPDPAPGPDPSQTDPGPADSDFGYFRGGPVQRRLQRPFGGFSRSSFRVNPFLRRPAPLQTPNFLLGLLGQPPRLAQSTSLGERSEEAFNRANPGTAGSSEASIRSILSTLYRTDPARAEALALAIRGATPSSPPPTTEPWGGSNILDAHGRVIGVREGPGLLEGWDPSLDLNRPVRPPVAPPTVAPPPPSPPPPAPPTVSRPPGMYGTDQNGTYRYIAFDDWAAWGRPNPSLPSPTLPQVPPVPTVAPPTVVPPVAPPPSPPPGPPPETPFRHWSETRSSPWLNQPAPVSSTGSLYSPNRGFGSSTPPAPVVGTGPSAAAPNPPTPTWSDEVDWRQVPGFSSGSGQARGGPVRGLIGPDPPGPDDGFGALDIGEFVIPTNVVRALGGFGGVRRLLSSATRGSRGGPQ